MSQVARTQIDRSDRVWCPADDLSWSGPVYRDRDRLDYSGADELTGEVPPELLPVGAGLPGVAYRPIVITDLDAADGWGRARLYGGLRPPRMAPRLDPGVEKSSRLKKMEELGELARRRSSSPARPAGPPPIRVIALPVDSPLPAPGHPRQLVTDPADPDMCLEWQRFVANAANLESIRGVGVQGAEPPASVHTLTRNSLRVRLLRLFLAQHGMQRLSHRVENCGCLHRAVRVVHRPGCTEDHGEVHVQHSQCGVTGCPRCEADIARHRARVLAGKLAVAWVGQPKGGRYARHLVLTVRSGLQAGETISAPMIAHNARHAKRCFAHWWKTYVKGCDWGGEPGACYKLEVGPSGNVHLHVATLGMRWINQQWLSESWAACGGDPVVWVTGAYYSKRRSGKRELRGVAGMVSEVAKYITKPQGVDGSWWLAPLVAIGLHGVRVWETMGSLRGIAEQVDHWVRYRHRACEYCGSDRHVRGRWMRSPAAALESLSWREAHPRAPPSDEFRRWWAAETGRSEEHAYAADPWSVFDGAASAVHRPTMEWAARKAWHYFWVDEPRPTSRFSYC